MLRNLLYGISNPCDFSAESKGSLVFTSSKYITCLMVEALWTFETACSTSIWHKPKENVMSGTHLEPDGTELIPMVLLEKGLISYFKLMFFVVNNVVFPVTCVSVH